MSDPAQNHSQQSLSVNKLGSQVLDISTIIYFQTELIGRLNLQILILENKLLVHLKDYF